MEKEETATTTTLQKNAAAESSGGAAASAAAAAESLEALRKCLEKNNGDRGKCRDYDALISTIGDDSAPKPLIPLRLRTRTLTDV